MPVARAEEGLCCAPVTEAPLDAAAAGELARVLSALADPVRLQLGRSQPTISHHTRVLVEAGLLRGEKRGRWTWWSLVPGRLAEVRSALGG